MLQISLSQIGRSLALIAATTVATWLVTRPAQPTPPPPLALSITLPTEHVFVDTALSPDGSVLIYSAIADGRI